MEDAAARALAKLEQSLSPATRAHVSSVARALVPLASPSDEITAEVIVAVAHAIAGSQRVRVNYRPRSGEPAERRIEPHRVVQTDRRWYLTAWDCDRGDWRTFRLDRVTAVVPLRETFTARQMPTADLRASTSAAITTAPYRYQVALHIHAAADVVERHFGPTIAQVIDRGDGTSTLETGSSSLTEIALYVGTSGLPFQVLPGTDALALRRTLRELAARLLRGALP
jgi:predicted DNA-binding transcriptional regulator YafY